MPNIYFIRHAESVFNQELASIGDPDLLRSKTALKDCGLTDLGKEQARMLDEELKDVTMDVIVVSPMRRTKETFRCMPNLFNNSQAKVYASELCREYKTDICDFTVDEPIIYESEDDIINRVRTFKEYLQIIIQDAVNVAVITHGDFIYYCCEEDRTKDESIYHVDNARYVIQSC